MTATKTCRATVPPDGKACGKPAVRLVTFTGEDNDTVCTCIECALRLKQIAEAHGTTVKVGKLQ